MDVPRTYMGNCKRGAALTPALYDDLKETVVRSMLPIDMGRPRA
jgi:hypothetical protein